MVSRGQASESTPGAGSGKAFRHRWKGKRPSLELPAAVGEMVPGSALPAWVTPTTAVLLAGSLLWHQLLSFYLQLFLPLFLLCPLVPYFQVLPCQKM